MTKYSTAQPLNCQEVPSLEGLMQDVAFGVGVGILSMVPQPGCRGISVLGPGYPVGLEPFPWLVPGLSADHSVQSIPAPAPAPDTCTTPVE